MNTQTKTCDRCDSTIVEQAITQTGVLRISRCVDGNRSYESKDVRLCSMCWGELWHWTSGEDVPDRSGVADPVSLNRMADSVERHINELEGVLEAVDDQRND